LHKLVDQCVSSSKQTVREQRQDVLAGLSCYICSCV